jgi:hypothetical protein
MKLVEEHISGFVDRSVSLGAIEEALALKWQRLASLDGSFDGSREAGMDRALFEYYRGNAIQLVGIQAGTDVIKSFGIYQLVLPGNALHGFSGSFERLRNLAINALSKVA